MSSQPWDRLLNINMAAPHLLTLPRELRDQIYSYLSDDGPGWRLTSLFSPKPVQFRFHNAPNLSVLHTHPRLRTEFFEADWTKELSVTFRLGVPRGPFTNLITLNTTYESPTLPADILFTHWVRHVTILVDRGHKRRGDNAPGKFWWKAIQQLIDALSEKAVFLSTVKVAIQQHATTRLRDHHQAYPRFSSRYFITPPPSFLNGLWLVQRCEGYRLALDMVLSLVPPPHPGHPPIPLPTGSPHTRVVHGVVKIGCYLYACGDYRERLWERNEVKKLFPVKAYSSACELPPAILAHEMREWREKRGHGEAEVWFPER
jgi:hypothetical protein